MPVKFYRLPQVIEIACLSRSTIYRLIGMGQFPAPVKLGLRATAWRVEDVDAWIANRVEGAK
jgi:prophage regulatory protein